MGVRVANDRIRKIAINTGGGDAPGLNAVIRAVVLCARRRGWEVEGIRDGFDGILNSRRYPDGGLIPLDGDTVRGITHLGGTILGTTNKGHPLRYPTELADGTVVEKDRSAEILETFETRGIDALVAIGGDGSMAIAHALSLQGLRVVGIPKTIDNDLEGTHVTFGFQTAVSFATDCIGRLHATAASHQRTFVVEVMGRYAGWIALHSGVAGTADVILMPEIPYDIEKVADKIQQRTNAGKRFSIVVVAEGATPIGGDLTLKAAKQAGRAERLGGVGELIAHQLQELTGQDSRYLVLGHLLRGGSPSSFDRLISLRFGAAAVRCLACGDTGVMVALDPPVVNHVPLERATSRMKVVPLDSDTVLTARELGVSFGD